MPRAAKPVPASTLTAARQRRRFDERDRAIREAARRLLVERGLHGFSMEDVADAIEYSKGTVYLHYASKEDALVASCADRLAQLAATLETAAARSGTTRARMSALAESHGRFLGEQPVRFHTVPMLHSPTVLEKAAPSRIAAIETALARALSACTGIVRDAIAHGDLVLRGAARPEDVAFAFWALTLGAHMNVDLHAPNGLLGVTDAAAAVRAHWETYMDGLGWKPRRRPVPLARTTPAPGARRGARGALRSRPSERSGAGRRSRR